MTNTLAGCPRLFAALTAGLLLAAPRLALAQSLGSWSPLERLPVSMAHTMLLSNGMVLFWGEAADGQKPFLWDPESDALQPLSAAPTFNTFCGGHVLLPDGRLFEAGGYLAPAAAGGPSSGLPNAAIFDPSATSWTNLPNMSGPRMCPTVIGLANGDPLVITGTETTGSANGLTAAPGAINPLSQIYDLSAGHWTDLSTILVKPPMLARAFLAPDGRVFVAGPGARGIFLDLHGTGASLSGPTTNLGTERGYGGAVMYDVGKVLLAGGGLTPTASAETIDLTAAAPAWTTVAPMSVARRHLNATLLPDGTVLVVGGTKAGGAVFNDSTGAVLQPELWDPAKNTWTTLTANATYRGYGSTALLLPDGRVLVGGGHGAAYLNYEIFSPPYLASGGARPLIDEAPSQLWPASQFFVRTAAAATVGKVALVRLGSTTHSWDMNQRYVPLSFTTDGANGLGLVVNGPTDNNAAPSGSYMLFLVDTNGVPSEAKMVDVVYGPTAGPAPALNVPAPDAPAPAPQHHASKAKSGCSVGGNGLLPLPGLLALSALLLLRRRAKAQLGRE